MVTHASPALKQHQGAISVTFKIQIHALNALILSCCHQMRAVSVSRDCTSTLLFRSVRSVSQASSCLGIDVSSRHVMKDSSLRSLKT